MNYRFLIILTDSDGIASIKLCHADAENFVYLGADKEEGDPTSWKEAIPLTITEAARAQNGEDIEDVITVTSGSPDNDRAIHVPFIEQFDTISDLIDYVRDNDVAITGEYAGMAY